MKDAPAFDFYPERWLAGVAEMSDADQLVYLRLLCHSWLRDGLTDDAKAISRLAGRKVSDAVLVKFPVAEDGLRRNPRLEKIRRDQRERIGKAKLKSEKMHRGRYGESRRQQQSTCSASSTATSSHQAVLADCPPLTTHPNGGQQQPAGARGHCDLDEARAYAVSYSKGNPAGIAIPMHVVSQWHDTREAVGWITVKGGLELPIADWQADLRTFATHYQKNELLRPTGSSSAKRAEREPPAAITAKDLPRL